MYAAAKPSPSENVARPSRSSEARYVSQFRSDSGVMEDCCPYAATHITRPSKIKNGFLIRTSSAVTARVSAYPAPPLLAKEWWGTEQAVLPPENFCLLHHRDRKI